jgi:hypothetical protein
MHPYQWPTIFGKFVLQQLKYILATCQPQLGLYAPKGNQPDSQRITFQKKIIYNQYGRIWWAKLQPIQLIPSNFTNFASQFISYGSNTNG